jgi:hypothetical protein
MGKEWFMMKQKSKDIIFFIKENTKNFSIFTDELDYFLIKKNDILKIENKKLIKVDEEQYFIKNIFQAYNKDVYDLYLEISNFLKEVCDGYGIYKEKQRYMIYGKIEKYSITQNTMWFDFPGTSIPLLYGIIPLNEKIELNLKNLEKNKNILLNKGDIFINKPTDLVNFKVEKDIDVLEFYISPISILKNNEPGVWIPIL